jgi:hypothetical protein
VVAALAEREEQGGYWRVDTSLTRTSTFGQTLVEPVDDEPYARITEQDLIDHGVDQVSPWDTFTQFTPPVAFIRHGGVPVEPMPVGLGGEQFLYM